MDGISGSGTSPFSQGDVTIRKVTEGELAKHKISLQKHLEEAHSKISSLSRQVSKFALELKMPELQLESTKAHLTQYDTKLKQDNSKEFRSQKISKELSVKKIDLLEGKNQLEETINELKNKIQDNKLEINKIKEEIVSTAKLENDFERLIQEYVKTNTLPPRTTPEGIRNEILIAVDRNRLLSAKNEDPVVRSAQERLNAGEKSAVEKRENLRRALPPGIHLVTEDKCIASANAARINDSQGVDIERYLAGNFVKLFDKDGIEIEMPSYPELEQITDNQKYGKEIATARFKFVLDQFMDKLGFSAEDKEKVQTRFKEIAEKGSLGEGIQKFFNEITEGKMAGIPPQNARKLAHLLQCMSQSLILTPMKALLSVGRDAKMELQPRSFDKSIHIQFGENGNVILKTVSFASEKVKNKTAEQIQQESLRSTNFSFEMEVDYEVRMQNTMRSNLNDLENWTSDIQVSVGTPPGPQDPRINGLKESLTLGGFNPASHPMVSRKVRS